METLSQVLCWDKFSNFQSLLFQKFTTLTIWVLSPSISGKAKKTTLYYFHFVGRGIKKPKKSYSKSVAEVQREQNMGVPKLLFIVHYTPFYVSSK